MSLQQQAKENYSSKYDKKYYYRTLLNAEEVQDLVFSVGYVDKEQSAFELRREFSEQRDCRFVVLCLFISEEQSVDLIREE